MKIGIIGLGIMGRRLASAAVRDGHSACGWDLRPESAERAQAEIASLRLLKSPQEVVAQAELVHVATPPSTHAEYARLADREGRPLLCEKPLGVDLAESRRLVRELRVPAAVNFPFATHPGVGTLRKRLGEEAGSLVRVEIRLHFPRWPREWQQDAAGWLDRRAEGGFLREVFSHFAFLTHRLVGPPIFRRGRVEFPSDGISAERAAWGEFDAAGVPVRLAAAVGGAAPDSNEWTAYGTRRSFRLEDWGNLFFSDGDRWEPIAPDAAPGPRLAEQLRALQRMLRGEPHDLAGLDAGLAVQEAVESLWAAR